MEGVKAISIPLQGPLCKFQNCSSKFQGRRHSGWKSWGKKNSQRLEEEPVSEQGGWGTIFPIRQQRRRFLSKYLKYQQIIHPTHPFLEWLGAESGNVSSGGPKFKNTIPRKTAVIPTESIFLLKCPYDITVHIFKSLTVWFYPPSLGEYLFCWSQAHY